MKNLSVLAIGLLMSIVPLYGAYGSKGRIMQEPMQQEDLEITQESELYNIKDPVPLTEEEQLALVKKMGLPDMEEKTDTESPIAEEM